MNVTKNFAKGELMCRHCGKMEIPQRYCDMLQALRDALGKPLIITSGYRCPEYNKMVSGTGVNGPHTKGAFDILAAGDFALQIVVQAAKLGFTGIGLRQHGAHETRFVHVDALPLALGRPRPWVWTYP